MLHQCHWAIQQIDLLLLQKRSLFSCQALPSCCLCCPSPLTIMGGMRAGSSYMSTWMTLPRFRSTSGHLQQQQINKIRTQCTAEQLRRINSLMELRDTQ
jgi:hypothetical protein